MAEVLVLGAGSWGTVLAQLLATQGLDVRLWCRRSELARELSEGRCNRAYLPGIRLDARIQVVTGDRPCAGSEGHVILVVPVQSVRSVLEVLAEDLPKAATYVTASKGIEHQSHMRVSEVIRQVVGPSGPIVALSGPSFAEEVAVGDPTAVTAASESELGANDVQKLFSSKRFRVYTSADIVGVEFGGALKNVIALACGIVDGLSLGRNAQAALMTRGLAEMTRLGVALGGRTETFTGLAGMGDLVLTASGELSRNRRVGFELGQGRKLTDVLGELGHVAEGVETARAVRQLGAALDVELPITSEVASILFDGASPRGAVSRLMERDLKPEVWGQ